LTSATGPTYNFGAFRLDASSRRLWRGDQPVPLGQKATDALVRLLHRPGEIVEKGELIGLLWPDTIVDENNLSQQISALRRALGENAEQPRHIITVPGRGYRFLSVPLSELPPGPQPSGGAGGNTPANRAHGAGAVHETVARESSGGLAARARILKLSVLLTSLLTAALAAGVVTVWHNRDEAVAAGMIRSLAVLPFRPMNPAAGDEHFGLGIADAIVKNLTEFEGVLVQPTGAVRRYARTPSDPSAAGRTLGVDAVLDGTVHRDGDRLRVSVQLVRVDNAASVWTERFDTEWRDIFSVQDRIARQVARALALRLNGADAVGPLARRPTADSEAYASYLKSRYFWNKRSGEGYLKAISHAQAALDRDPGFAQAYAAIADCYALLGSSPDSTIDRREGMRRARQAAERALSIDPSLADAATSLAFVKMHYDWDWAEAERLFQHAIRLDPTYATAHHWYAYYLTARQRHEEAIAHVRRASELDPLSVIIATDVGELLLYAGRMDEAVSAARVALELDPGFPQAHRVLAWADMRRGHYEGALERLVRAPGRSDTSSGDLRSTIGHLYGRTGRTQPAEDIIKALQRQRAVGSEPAIELSIVYTGLGRHDEAFDSLEQSFRARSGSLILLLVEPLWAPLREDPRFRHLARRVGLIDTN
jgi:DNA-binding winged helix-turn-helix (wHTH) protein/TolB-like protein/tetratricopeptide (TPR) repeat protein